MEPANVSRPLASAIPRPQIPRSAIALDYCESTETPLLLHRQFIDKNAGRDGNVPAERKDLIIWTIESIELRRGL